MAAVLPAPRVPFLDYLKGFVISLVVLDHSLHAYSLHYAKYWFLPDFDRSVGFDILHLHNDGFMMPSMFFFAGLVLFASLKRRGLVSFLKERLLRLGIPFIAGVIFVCPFLSYPKYLAQQDSNIGYWDYCTTVYLKLGPDSILQAGPFWFLSYLALLTVIALIIYYTVPRFYTLLRDFCQWVMEKPLPGLLVIALLGILIQGLSDLRWGAHWWIHFGRDVPQEAWSYPFWDFINHLFYARGARFIFKAYMFFLGLGFGYAGLLHNHYIWQKLANSWAKWAGAALLIGITYISVTLLNFDEVYNNDLRRFLFLQGGDWEDTWPLIVDTVPMILLRTTLLALFIFSQIMAYLALFRRFLNHDSATWQSLAMCSYGIYIIHEPFVVASQWYLQGSDVPIAIRFLMVGFGSLFISWFIMKNLLTKMPSLRRIIG